MKLRTVIASAFVLALGFGSVKADPITWNISFQLTGTLENTSLQQTPNVLATVTGTIVTDTDSGFLLPSDFISWSFTYSAPAVGFAGSASSASGGLPAIAGNVLNASGHTLSYVFDPNTVIGPHAFFTDAPSQVAFGIDLNFDHIVQGDIRLQDAFFDQLDAPVTQPFIIGTEAAAVPLHSSWQVNLLALIGFGFMAYRRKSKPALMAT